MQLLAYNAPTAADGQVIGLMFAGTGADKSLYALEYYSSEILKIDYLGDKTVDNNTPVAKSPAGVTKSSKSAKSSASLFSFTSAIAAIFVGMFYIVL